MANKFFVDTDSTKKWYALYTKSRQEKTVAKKLNDYGIETYCPLRRTKRRWSDRWKWVEMPLFSSYCFVRLDEQERNLVFQAPGVVQYVFWLGQPAVIKDEEIDQIKVWLNDFDHEEIEVQSYSKGDKIIVESGPLMDQKGEIVTKQGNNLLLRLEGLGMILWVNASRNHVEKLIEVDYTIS